MKAVREKEPQLWLQAGNARAPLQQGRGLLFPTHEHRHSMSKAKAQAGGARALPSPSGAAEAVGWCLPGRRGDGSQGQGWGPGLA